MYIKNVEGWEGDGDFLSKFNIQIRDQITFTVARRSFFRETKAEKLVRPNEGDLIFLPLNNKVFEIKYVDNSAIFYQLGSLQTWDLKCELFEYNNQRIRTGIAEIDAIEKRVAMSSESYAILTETQLALLDQDGFMLMNEKFSTDDAAGDALADNDEIQLESDGFLDFTEADPFSEGNY